MDREVLTAVGKPRARSSIEGMQISYEFEFDAEHGTILRSATLSHGEPMIVTEAVRV